MTRDIPLINSLKSAHACTCFYLILHNFTHISCVFLILYFLSFVFFQNHLNSHLRFVISLIYLFVHITFQQYFNNIGNPILCHIFFCSFCTPTYTCLVLTNVYETPNKGRKDKFISRNINKTT